MRVPRVLTAVAASAVVAVAAAACGSSGGTPADQTPASPAQEMTIAMADNAFAPSSIAARVGEPVTFKFVNSGQVTHEAFFGSEAEQEDHAAEMQQSADGGHAMHMNMGHDMNMGTSTPAGTEIVTVPPGEQAVVVKTFDRIGTVVIGCHQPGHWESGMKATVNVT